MASRSEPKAEVIPAAPDCTLVIFGAHGDLTKRLLIPALYNLTRDGRLGSGFKVLGVDHNDCSEEAFREVQTGFIESLAADRSSEFGATSLDAKTWADLRGRLFYQTGDFEAPATYAALKDRLAALGGSGGETLGHVAEEPRRGGAIEDGVTAVGTADFR